MQFDNTLLYGDNTDVVIHIVKLRLFLTPSAITGSIVSTLPLTAFLMKQMFGVALRNDNEMAMQREIRHKAILSVISCYIFSLTSAFGDVTSVLLAKPLYGNDEGIVLTGTVGSGQQSVFVLIRGPGPSENFVGMVSDPSADADGTFTTIPRPVDGIFQLEGTYRAIAFSSDQKEQDGISLLLNYDGTYVSDPNMASHVVRIPAGSANPGCEETNECFLPSVLAINIGDIVTWTNEGIAAYTVTSGTPEVGADGMFDSGLLLSQNTFSYRFDQEGLFQYYSLAQLWMRGTVVVGHPIRDVMLSIQQSTNLLEDVWTDLSTVTITVTNPSDAIFYRLQDF